MSEATTKKRRPIVGYRTMTSAQRYNARMERLFEDCKDAQTRFNASSRTEPPTEPRAGELCTRCGGNGRDPEHDGPCGECGTIAVRYAPTNPPVRTAITQAEATEIKQFAQELAETDLKYGFYDDKYVAQRVEEILNRQQLANQQRITELEAALSEILTDFLTQGRFDDDLYTKRLRANARAVLNRKDGE